MSLTYAREAALYSTGGPVCRDVAADVGLRTTCVQCDAGSTPRMIMGLIVAGLQVGSDINLTALLPQAQP